MACRNGAMCFTKALLASSFFINTKLRDLRHRSNRPFVDQDRKIGTGEQQGQGKADIAKPNDRILENCLPINRMRIQN
jgi:hypothetical protein